MDSQYLKQHINDALSEALSSMAVALPEDSVEYVGNFLIEYCERRKRKGAANDALTAIEAKLAEATQQEEARAAVAKAAEDERKKREGRLAAFTNSLQAEGSNKREVMDSVSKFLAEFLDLPAVYIAFKRPAGETETLNYYSASPGQSHVVGRKLLKPAEESEEEGGPARQGVSFDAFKLPPQPEEEEAGEEEEEEGAPPKPPKPVPVPQPLVIDNVMRDKRVQFFGIPRLGSYLAVPFSFDSCDHAGGITEAPAPVPDEEGNTPPPPAEPFVRSPIPSAFVIAADTQGAFRRFTDYDIATIKRVGEALIERLRVLEDEMFNAQLRFIRASGKRPVALDALIASQEEEEGKAAAAATAVAAPPAAEEGGEAPPAEDGEAAGAGAKVAEVLPYADAVARANFHTQRLILPEVSSVTLQYMQCVLPPPAQALQLLYAAALMCGIRDAELKDDCGDISWDKVKANFIQHSTAKFHVFEPTASVHVKKENTLGNVRAFAEANNIFDAAGLPASMASLPFISTWLQKSIAARESVLAYHKENNLENLEVVV